VYASMSVYWLIFAWALQCSISTARRACMHGNSGRLAGSSRLSLPRRHMWPAAGRRVPHWGDFIGAWSERRAGWRGWAGGGWQAPGEGQRMSRRKPPGWGAFSAPFGSTLYSPACNLLVIYIPPTHHTPCSPGHPSCVHINTPTPVGSTMGQHAAGRQTWQHSSNSFCAASRPTVAH
jgi:hypothetical protein